MLFKKLIVKILTFKTIIFNQYSVIFYLFSGLSPDVRYSKQWFI
jgi:hypothetical protein